ncbi:MAG: hypothetical protein JSR69_21840 [Proteobacteria bacterium]|nr:hypothetical protein [Pseudomonadota bacterium]
MTHGVFSWLALIIYGLLLCYYGLDKAPEHMLWGKPFYVWPLRASWLMMGVGLLLGIFYAATGRLRNTGTAPGGRGRSFLSRDVGASAALGAAVVGPMVNVDGTPMTDGGTVDVMGKVYGDSGSSFSDMGGISSTDMGSSSIGGSNW